MCYNNFVFDEATPKVKVTPRIQSRRPAEEAVMFCHVVGEPFPKVRTKHLIIIRV